MRWESKAGQGYEYGGQEHNSKIYLDITAGFRIITRKSRTDFYSCWALQTVVIGLKYTSPEINVCA